MPLYEYECASCEHRFDKLISHAAADEVACPRCDTPRARRLLSVIAGLSGRADLLNGPSGGSMGGGGGCGGGCACSC